jgi:uncharacterized MAPEG superfamily protein
VNVAIDRNQQSIKGGLKVLHSPSKLNTAILKNLTGDRIMTIELKYLTFVSLLTALMWVPYILNTIMVRGLVNAVGYSDNPKPLSHWASRMKAAHGNAIENLVVFAALVLIANVSAVSNEITTMACLIYFWARLVHYLVYTFGIPWIRTLAFATGSLCQIALAVQILGSGL